MFVAPSVDPAAGLSNVIDCALAHKSLGGTAIVEKTVGILVGIADEEAVGATLALTRGVGPIVAVVVDI